MAALLTYLNYILANFKNVKTNTTSETTYKLFLLRPRYPRYPWVVQLLRNKSVSSKTGINMELVMGVLESHNENQKLTSSTPIVLNKNILTSLNRCSFPWTVIRMWNNISVTYFHLSKIRFSSKQFRSFFTDCFIITIY